MDIKTEKNTIVSKRPGRRAGTPLYLEVSQKLREVMASTGLRPGDQMPAISQVAEELGVNYRTAKTAFSLLKKDGLIEQEPNKQAVVARRTQKKLKTVFIRWQGDAFIVGIERGMKRFCQEHEIDLSVIDVNRSHERYLNAIENPGANIDGMLIMPHEHESYIKVIRESMGKGGQYVFLDRELPGIDVSCVASDHFSGAYEATKHLLETHGLPVYYVGAAHEPASCRQWVQAWRQAMADYNFMNQDKYLFPLFGREMDWVLSEDYGFKVECQAARRLFEERDEPKYCVFAGNDYVARGVYHAAQERGLKIGRDVFVVGFGDMPLCKRMNVALSSVFQNSEMVGYEGARVLYEHLTGALTNPISRLIPVELHVRASSIGA